MDANTSRLISVIKPLLRFMDCLPTEEQLSAVIPSEGITGRAAVVRASNVVMDIKHEFSDSVVDRTAASRVLSAINLKRRFGFVAYGSNPCASSSSPWSTPDYLRSPSGYSQICDKYEADFLATPPLEVPFKYRVSHPFDALLAERRAILAGERAMLENEAKKDRAWLYDRMRG